MKVHHHYRCVICTRRFSTWKGLYDHAQAKHGLAPIHEDSIWTRARRSSAVTSDHLEARPMVFAMFKDPA